jgi:hypothetical protein
MKTRYFIRGGSTGGLVGWLELFCKQVRSSKYMEAMLKFGPIGV